MNNDPARSVHFDLTSHDAMQLSGLSMPVDMNKPVVINAPNPALHDESGSGSSGDSGESDHDGNGSLGQRHAVIDDADADGEEGQYHFAPPVSTTPIDEVPPLTNTTAAAYGWNAAGLSRSRTSQAVGVAAGPLDAVPSIQTNGMSTGRAARPNAVRTPSNAYAPVRRPNQFSINTSTPKHRSSSQQRVRRNPTADYRAQEKAYVQRIRQENENDDFFNDMSTPSVDYSSEGFSDDDSPSTADHHENDPYDGEILLFRPTEDTQPTPEQLEVPENRERLEWHSMLASVLTGDVVKQEKKRLIGGGEQQGDNSLKSEIWMGIRAKVCGRSLQVQRRVVDEGRSRIKDDIEEIINFEIKGTSEAGEDAAVQVKNIVKKIEKCESLFPTRQALEAAYPKVASAAYKASCDAVLAWYNTTELISTEMFILKNWVGNDELDFSKPRTRSEHDHHLTDDSSFIDRILKEDGLKSLQGKNNLLVALEQVIYKAKSTLIANAKAFADRHLPPYMEELLTLINFPSRLVQEIIRMRLSYAQKIKDPAQQGSMMAEQMISQFQILLTLACRIKEGYTDISTPEEGWDLPPCIEENFDSVVLDALKFYFKMLNWKLSANKNTFKEAEILEQEWEFSNKLGRQLEGGDVEVAEQFR